MIIEVLGAAPPAFGERRRYATGSLFAHTSRRSAASVRPPSAAALRIASPLSLRFYATSQAVPTEDVYTLAFGAKLPNIYALDKRAAARAGVGARSRRRSGAQLPKVASTETPQHATAQKKHCKCSAFFVAARPNTPKQQ